MRLSVLVLAASAAVFAEGCAKVDHSQTAAAAKQSFSAAALTPEEAWKLIQASRTPGALTILDVRTPEEFAEGHLHGALLYNFKSADFADKAAKLPRDAHYLLYCRSGHRSGLAAERLQQLGFTDIQQIGGGILAWQRAGLPLEK